ncbi:effector binding domain-containing protein [Clostridium botulinum]|nr:effector binding domain-containing protein [Clostridium botulinum]
MKAMQQCLEMPKMKKSPFSKEEEIQIIKMFDEYCPGINEENDKPNNEFGENASYSEIVGTEGTSFDYIPEGMVAKVIPQGKYVVFTHKGSVEKSQETYEYI